MMIYLNCSRPYRNMNFGTLIRVTSVNSSRFNAYTITYLVINSSNINRRVHKCYVIPGKLIHINIYKNYTT